MKKRTKVSGIVPSFKKSKGFAKSMSKGLTATAKQFGLMATGGVFYKEAPQVRGRLARGLAKKTKGGTGKVSMRPSYKKDMKTGVRDKTRQERGKLVRALAKNTKGGTGLISKRSSYRRHLPKRR
jgi:hypothetical protein